MSQLTVVKTGGDIVDPTNVDDLIFAVDNAYYFAAQAAKAAAEEFETLEALEGRLAEIKAAAPNERQVTEMRDAIVHGRKLAGRKLIAQHIALMMGAWPTAKPPEPQTFVKLLAADVERRKPCILGIETAFRELRRKCRFLPSIAEVLDAINDAERSWALRAIQADRLLDDYTRNLRILEDRSDLLKRFVPGPKEIPPHVDRALKELRGKGT